ncbi:hypothetical protein HDV05_007074 [Chytridiales sp. JEL 0842]|nr:hypothetical protein HDV05_007074 [Chytridiales sp. JEL 0842]
MTTETSAPVAAVEATQEQQSLKRKAEDVVPEVPLATTTTEETEKKVKTTHEETVVAPAAEQEAVADDAEKEEDDDVSIYPDSEELYAYPASGESGIFLACHRVVRIEEAIPAAKTLIEKNIESVIPAEDEKEKDETAAPTEEDVVDDLKYVVNEAIEEAFAITLMDANFKFPDVNGEAVEEEKKEEEKTETPAVVESEASKAFRDLVTKAAADKAWIKIKVARDQPTSETEGFVPITVSDLDPREGLIVPKISFWRYLVAAEVASSEVTEGVKTIMSKFL